MRSSASDRPNIARRPAALRDAVGAAHGKHGVDDPSGAVSNKPPITATDRTAYDTPMHEDRRPATPAGGPRGQRLRWLRAATFAGLCFAAGACAAQSSGAFNAPGMSRAGAVPMREKPQHSVTASVLRQSKEMSEVRNCTSANAATLSLIRAAEEVVTTVNTLRNAGASVATYQQQLLDKQWKTYKSLGGTAASPEQVKPPEDPCKAAKEALHQKSVALENEYRQCVESRANDIKVSELSKELVSGRNYAAMLDRIHENTRTAPKPDSGATVTSSRTATLKTDPDAVRAELAAKLEAYRSVGGPATRLEDVTEIPNPCIPRIRTRTTASPVARPQAPAVPAQ